VCLWTYLQWWGTTSGTNPLAITTSVYSPISPPPTPSLSMKSLKKHPMHFSMMVLMNRDTW
jgi:hypothetical protein